MSGISLRIFIVSALLVALGSALVVGNVAVGLPTATVAVEPKIISKAPNELFNVTITVADVTELYAWEFNLTFNPIVLEAISFIEGPFLKDYAESVGQTTLPLRTTVNNTGGWLFAGRIIFLYPEHGAAGSGILGYVTFKAKVVGMSDLQFSDTKLRSWDSTAMDLVAITHTSTGGFFVYPLWRDVAVTGVVAPVSVSAGQSVSINVTVKNLGNLSETFDVKTYYNSTHPIDTRANVTLQSGTEDVIVFSWDTSGLTLGNCTIKAEAILLGDNDTSNDVSYHVISIVGGAAPSPPSLTLPIELLIAVIVVIALGAGGIFLYMRRRSAKK